MTRSSHVSEGLAAARPAIACICAEVWDLAENSLHEVESSRVHVRELLDAGFDVREGVAGVPTAFVAEWSHGEDGRTVGVFFGLHDLVPNRPLAERMQSHLERVGVPSWTDEEQEFARACRLELGIAEHGMATSVMPLQPERAAGGSSDVAEASWKAPTMGILMPTMPLDVTWHTWPVTACGGMLIGLRGALAATEVLTLTALDILEDAELRDAARADFEQHTAGHEYVSPLRPEQLCPEGLPAWVATDGSTEALAELVRGAGA